MTVTNFDMSDINGKQMTGDCGDEDLNTSECGRSHSPLPSYEEQKRIIREATKKTLVIGDHWYLLDIHWYKQWKKYIELACDGKDAKSQHPGPIDNMPLFATGDCKLKEQLLEGSDYKLISDEGWSKLVSWYDIVAGQKPIKRTVIEQGLYNKEVKVEVYQIELKLALFADLENVIVKDFSKGTSVDEVVKDMKEIFSISGEETRVWNKFMTNTYELIPKLDQTLQDIGIGSGQMLVLEQRNEKNEWPRVSRSRSVSSSSGVGLPLPLDSPVANSNFASASYLPFSSNGYGSSTQRHNSTKPGLCGLANIGNTCFMNSALQCLSNTSPLTKYFVSNTYKHELNPSNPLGMHGKIAEAYAELMHQLWNGQINFVTPRTFKMQVGRFAPQFSGYQQQDSHELLAFLLDGLHEDLNRVKQKPYIEMKDDDGRPDHVVAKEAWRNHSLRNSSIIVDYFHGQFKSTVVCPECDKKSVTFDPFCYLSLPLPVKKERTLVVTLVPLDVSKKPIKLKVTVPKIGTILDLVYGVAKLTGADEHKLVVTDVFTSKFHKQYDMRESVSHITDRDDITIYEVPIDVWNADEEELLVLPIYLREIRSNSHYSSYSSSNSLFGRPMLVPVPKTSTAADLYKIIIRWMRRYVSPPNEMSNCKHNERETQDIQDDEEMLEDKCEDELKIKDDERSKETEEGEIVEDKKSEPMSPYLFEIKIVNSNGTSDLQSLNYEDSEPLKLTSRTHLAIDWYPKFKKLYYNSKLAEESEIHESCNMVPPSKKSIHLSDCLELFLQREKLGADDPWYCPVCKVHRQAFKKFDLWTLPKILVFHLKRFSYNRYWRDKLDVLVNFPIVELDLTRYVINKDHPRAVYDLHAVSNHYGGLGGGHYTAYGINCHDGHWYYFDDSSVSSADASSVVSKAAYVLFYTRRDDPENEMMNTTEILSENNDVFQSDDEKMEPN